MFDFGNKLKWIFRSTIVSFLEVATKEWNSCNKLGTIKAYSMVKLYCVRVNKIFVDDYESSETTEKGEQVRRLFYYWRVYSDDTNGQIEYQKRLTTFFNAEYKSHLLKSFRKLLLVLFTLVLILRTLLEKNVFPLVFLPIDFNWNFKWMLIRTSLISYSSDGRKNQRWK